MMSGLARMHPEQSFRFYYRPNRLFKSLSEKTTAETPVAVCWRGAPRARPVSRSQPGASTAGSRRTVCTFHDLFVMNWRIFITRIPRARFTEQARQAAANSDAIIAVYRNSPPRKSSSFWASSHRAFTSCLMDLRRLPRLAPRARENLVLFVGVIQRRKNVAPPGEGL